MPLSKNTHQRYIAGASLSSDEVAELCEYYAGLNKAFEGYTPREYLLVKNDVRINYERLKEMKEMRRAALPKATPKSMMDHALELFVSNPTNRDRFTEQWVARGLPRSKAYTYFGNLLNADGETLTLINKAKVAAFDAWKKTP